LKPSAAPSRAFRAIFAAGLLCGVLDITAAFVTWAPQGVTPARILRGIASGLLGPKALNGGWETAALGLACHFFIAFSAATVFYFASRKLTFMTRRPFLCGALYGIAVYLVMYWIVIPLVFGPRPFNWSATVIAIITHIVCVGTPISLMVHLYGGNPTPRISST
jgi:hypothetical protein